MSQKGDMDLGDDPEAPLLPDQLPSDRSHASSGPSEGCKKGSKYCPPTCQNNQNDAEEDGSTYVGIELQASTKDTASIDNTNNPNNNDEGDLERTCFICLADDENSDAGLVRCCTQCYTQVHAKCWKDWRNNQRITILRSHLLGLRVPRNQLLCSICKTGQAKVPEEDTSELEWLDRHNDDDSQSEDMDELSQFVDSKMCTSRLLFMNAVLLVIVLIVSILAVTLGHYYTGDIVLFSFIGVYEVGIFEILALMVFRRRQQMLTESPV